MEAAFKYLLNITGKLLKVERRFVSEILTDVKLFDTMDIKIYNY